MLDEESKEIIRERDKRIEWWRVLKILRSEYERCMVEIEGQFEVDDFDKFLQYNFGIRLNYDHEGKILGNYSIVDKNKHLIFLMKYGK